MYSSRRHLYYPKNFCVARFIFAFIRHSALDQTEGGMPPNRNLNPRRRSLILTAVLFFFVLPSLPICFALYRNYRWERSLPPTTIVPDLTGLPLRSATERAHAAHLKTEVLGSTWYTSQSPGHITLQSPEAGQQVPFETKIGVELAVNPPAFLAREIINQE